MPSVNIDFRVNNKNDSNKHQNLQLQINQSHQQLQQPNQQKLLPISMMTSNNNNSQNGMKHQFSQMN